MAEKARAVRKAQPSTSDLLTWSEAPPSDSPAAVSATRSHQPSDAVRKVLFGGQVTDEEAETFAKRKPCSGYKMKEMTGSGIFSESGDDATSESGNANPHPNKTGLRVYQQALNGISQISFSTEEDVTPKKPTSLPEVAKQRELSGTLIAESDAKMKKPLSDAKCKELSGHDIFGPPPENPPQSLAAARSLEAKERKDMGEPAPRAVRTSIKVSNPAGGHSNILLSEEPEVKTTKKIHNQKFQELTGNDIFKGDAPPGSTEKPLSKAKLREMSGSNIFAEGERVEPRDYFAGVRKPPGGESTIALV